MTEGVSGSQPIQPSKQQPSQRVSNEDVQQYVQLQAEMKQIEAILDIAQSMVQKQLQKARDQGKHVAFNFETIPSSGDAEQRGNIGTYNALQPQIATGIQSLAKRTALLKADDPSSADTYNGFLDQLEEIAKSFPNLSQKQIDTLNTISTKLHENANLAGKSTQTAYWNETGDMYQQMYLLNAKALEDYQNQAKKPQASQEEIEGAQKVASTLSDVQDKLGGAVAGSAVKWIESGGGLTGAAPEGAAPGAAAPGAKLGGAGGLQKAFADAILGKYMPGQEKYLFELSEFLMFDNMGAQMGNQLLSLMSNFSSANTDFNWGSDLHATGKDVTITVDGKKVKVPIYSGTPTQAKAQLSKELSKANSDYQDVLKSIEKIESQIKSIENNKSLKPSQKKQLIKGLDKIKTQLDASKTQLTKLTSILKNLKVEPVKGNSKEFVVKYTGPQLYENEGGKAVPVDWNQALPAIENIVSTGATASEATKWGVPEGGGLTKIVSQTNVFQQTYSDQGQNQQMMLQMRMTEIQQEWSVVSTGEQLLNQMFSTVAQAIYK